MTLEVAQKTVQRWESGEVVPNDKQVNALSKALRVTPSFFALPELEPVPTPAVSFRALSKMTAGERDRAVHNGRLGVEFYRWVESRFSLPDLDLPQVVGLPPEVAADSLRKSWDLGSLPIAHLIAQLELRGVRVLALPPGSRNVDAFSFYFEGRPYMFLDTTKTAERFRFDAAHELGHLVLHHGHEEPHGKAAEIEAQAFASAFLMPRASVLAADLRNASAEALIVAKKFWRVSAMALAYRVNALGLMTEWGYRSVCIELARRGFRSGEPESQVGIETSQVLTKVMGAIRRQGMTQREVSAVFGLPPDEFGQFMFGLTMTALRGSE